MFAVAKRRQNLTVLLSRGYRSVADRYGYRPSIRAEKLKLPTDEAIEAQRNNPQLQRFINAYRTYGHRISRLNPLITARSSVTMTEEQKKSLFNKGELDQLRYGFSEDTAEIECSNLLNQTQATKPTTVKSLKATLESIYCGTLAMEFDHVRPRSETEYFWLASQFEKEYTPISDSESARYARLMLESQAFDHFVGTKFPTTKRYGGEGAESMLVFIDALLNEAADSKVKELLIGMPHRGRLNLLACMLQYPTSVIFRKIKGLPEFNSKYNGAMCGDVLSHLFHSTEIQVPLNYGDFEEISTQTKHGVKVCLLPNPSHLEAVYPVTLGKARAKLCRNGAGDYGQASDDRPGDGILPLHLHGDASVCGQGLVQEALQQAGDCPHFGVGGSVHLVVNNQIGYTTQSDCARTSAHCTDMAKSVCAPVLHVNASDINSVVRAARLAVSYRQQFRRDIWINLVCFRKHGHNEMDDASQTQPLMSRSIKERMSIPDEYAEHLLSNNVCGRDALKVTQFAQKLQDEFSKCEQIDPPDTSFRDVWKQMTVPSQEYVTDWHTGVEEDLLRRVGERSLVVPDGFSMHPTLIKRVNQKRLEALKSGQNIDWATAETLAIGSLLVQGFNVRLAGQDVQRGTFAQRHWGVVDQLTDEIYMPLNDIESDQKGRLEVANTPLNEMAALGYEYGFSISSPNTLCMWEAQFGDFFNGAQIMIDTFIGSGMYHPEITVTFYLFFNLCTNIR